MNREDIIRMAREAEHLVIEDYYTNGPVRAFSEAQLERFAALVASAEREACAKVCEDLYPNLLYDKDIQKHWPERIRTNKTYAAAIRARRQA